MREAPTTWRHLLVAPLAALLLVAGAAWNPAVIRAWAEGAFPAASERAVPAARCGPGSQPEPALQGQVPRGDRVSGRSTAGYHCNLDVVGQHQGEGAGIQAAWYGRCAYYSTAFGGTTRRPGVQVIDLSDPVHPAWTANLVTPAMTEPWESLKVNERRGLLAAVHGNQFNGPAFFDVYDIRRDCRSPRLLSTLSLPSNIVGHEGAWAPDGLTYWVGMFEGLAAIDVRDPVHTRLLYADTSRVHGLSLSDDGNTAYLAMPSALPGEPNGVRIVDVSDIQARHPLPQLRTISTLLWTDGGVAQLTVPFTSGGRPFLTAVDEGGTRHPGSSDGFAGLRSPAGGTRIIDISDVRRPRTVSRIRLEVQLRRHADEQQADTQGNGLFGYQTHYCNLDRQTDPTALACGHFESGIRVFDLRDPYHPREIAYFNPPAQTGKAAQLPASFHVANPTAMTGAGLLYRDSVPHPNLTADWCTAQIRFYQPRNELWTSCMDNGLLVLRFSNGAYPLPHHVTKEN